jgi:beta-glucosidase
MTGTKYTRGAVKEGVYTNEYAGLMISVPKGFSVVGEYEMKMAHNADIQTSSDNKEKTRKLATKFDAAFWGTEEAMEVHFLNRSLGIPYDSDYTKEDYLNDLVKEYAEFYDKEGGKLESKGITKVTLGGKEYLRLEMVMEHDGRTGNCYLYVRKLDDNLIVRIDGVSWSGKMADYFEKLFLEN